MFLVHKYIERYDMSNQNKEDILNEIAVVKSLQLKFQNDNEVIFELDQQLAWLLEKLDSIIYGED